MEKFVLFELHEYMDMYPKKHVMTFKGEDEADIASNASMWAKEMNKNYSGGTTKYIRTLEKNEAYHWALDEIHKIVAHPWVTRTDGDLDSVDVDRIKNIYKMLEKSYQ